MSNDTVRQLEQNIREAKEILEIDKALQRLTQNQDFKKVIKQGYFEKEAVRLVHLKADPQMQTEASQKSIVAQIDAIGGLLSYFRTLGFNAMQAEKAIEADEVARDELLVEGLTQ